ncbi:MAG: Gfo/Idh/MocA family protein [Steroidobacteraceae bacterium]
MKTFSVGVIGAGDIARKVHLPVLLNMPNVQVQWLFDSSVERTRAVAGAFGIHAVEPCASEDLPACDVALIAIPVGARASYYDAFAARGTAVLAEKPFAASSAEHKALTERFEPYQLACGYMRRFYASTQLLRELVRTQPFGRLVRMKISEGNRSTGSRVDRSYLDDSRQSAMGGVLSELGCHSLDLALYITGARAYEAQTCEFVFDARVDRKVSANITLTGSDYLPDSGLILEYCVSWLDRQSNTIVLDFEKTTIWTEIPPGGKVRMGAPTRPSSAIELTREARAATTANQAFFLQWRSFLEGVQANTESEVSARSALLGTALIEDLYTLGGRHA